MKRSGDMSKSKGATDVSYFSNSVFEQDFLDTIPMPPEPPSSETSSDLPAAFAGLANTADSSPSFCSSPSSLDPPSSTFPDSPDLKASAASSTKLQDSPNSVRAATRRESRWDRSNFTSPKKEPSNGFSVFSAKGEQPFEVVKTPPKPMSPVVVIAKGVRRGACTNLGFRMSYHGLGLKLPGEDSDIGSEIGIRTEEGTPSPVGSLKFCFSPVAKVRNGPLDPSEWDKTPPDKSAASADVDANVEQDHVRSSLDLCSQYDIAEEHHCAVKVDEQDPVVASPTNSQEQGVNNENNELSMNGDCSSSPRPSKAKFGKFKFLGNNATSNCSAGGNSSTDDSGRSGAPSVCASEDSDSGGVASSVPTSEADEAVTGAADSQSECSSKEQAEEEDKQSHAIAVAAKSPGGRRRRGTGQCSRWAVEEPPGGRRRSSRIRSMEERRERERLEKLGVKEPEVKPSCDDPHSPEAPSVPSPSPTAVPVPPPPPPPPETTVSENEVPYPASEEEDRLQTHLIPLPPMTPPRLSEPMDTSDSDQLPLTSVMGNGPNQENGIPGSMLNGQFAVPVTPASTSSMSTSPGASNSPLSSDDLNANRPEKVKSRWRRSSEMEGVGTALPSSGVQFPTTFGGSLEGISRPDALMTPPLLPAPSTPMSMSPTQVPNSTLPPPPPPPPSSLSPSSNCANLDAPCAVPVSNSEPPQLPQSFAHLSIAPTGFFSPGEITEDWSEKEVYSSLTQNPLPLRLKVVPPVINTESDSSGSKHAKASSTIPPKDRPPYLNYEELAENVYVSERRRMRSKKDVKRMICDCTLTKEEIERGFSGCTDDCLNRLLMMECGSRCPTGEHCANRRFQKREYPKLEPFKTEKKGWGLKTTQDLPVGTFVMEYVGEVLDQREFKRRVKEYAHDRQRHYYFMALRADEIIDATMKGNFSRFINHSCDPNCETQKWTVNGELRVGFFTRRDVVAEEELTFDYQFQRYGKEAQRCLCEASNCRGLIGGDKQTPLKKERRDVKKKKTAEERRREILEDMDLEEEIEKFNQLGGLRNRNQTLNLCRLMVRAEDTVSRLVLLRCLQKTEEQPCLRLFLDYHGLSLMWSWMVDIGNAYDTIPLKSEILKTLQALPISNKNMLVDSKIIAVVERWASQIAEHEAQQDEAMESTSSESKPLDGVIAVVDVVLGNEESAKSNGTADNPIGLTADERLSDAELQELCSDQVTRAVLIAHGMLDPDAPVLKKFEVADNNYCDSFANNSSEDSRCSNVAKSDEGQNAVSDMITTDASVTPKEGCVHASKLEAEDSQDKNVALDSDFSKKSEDGQCAIVEEENSNSCIDNGNTELPLVKQECQLAEKLEVSNLATSLLEAWGGLKEVYRIPKREQIENRREHEREADKEDGDRDRDFDRDCDSDGDYDREKEAGRDYTSDKSSDRDRERERDRDRDRDRDREWDRDRDWERDRDRDRDRGRDVKKDRYSDSYDRTRGNGDYDRNRNSRDNSPVDRDRDRDPRSRRNKRMRTSDHSKGSKRLLPTPPKLSKEERRQLFELKVQQEEEKAALRRQQAEFYRQQQEAQMIIDPMYYDPGYVQPTGGPQFFDPNLGYPLPPVPLPPPVGDPTLLPPPIVPPESNPVTAAPVGPVPPPIPPVLPIDPALAGSPLPPLGPPMGVPPPVAVPPSPSTQFDPNVPTGPPTPIVYPVFPPPNPQIPTHPVPPPYIAPPPAAAPHYVAPQPQPLYYSTPQGMMVHLPDQPPWPHVVPAPVLEEAVPPPPEPIKPAKPPKLPPNWKTAKDAEGNMYYYHVVTRQTQWEPPTADDNDMDLGTPTYDEPKASKKKSTTAADSSSELARRTKELFRTKMSQFIVQCLNPYRKPDCKLGRISSTEEFKHLARKLTHFVMAKELKHCRNVEDLECNDNVKHKAKDFVKKYMAKFGPVFKKSASPKDDDD